MSTYASNLAFARPALQARSLSVHAHWLPRAAFAAVFLYHGLGKLADLGGFAAMMDLPLFLAGLVALAEVGGGLAVLIGGFLSRDWLTRLGALATIPVLLGAIALVHWGQWSFVATDTHPMGGMEFQVLLLAVGLWLLLSGNGQGR